MKKILLFCFLGISLPAFSQKHVITLSGGPALSLGGKRISKSDQPSIVPFATIGIEKRLKNNKVGFNINMFTIAKGIRVYKTTIDAQPDGSVMERIPLYNLVFNPSIIFEKVTGTIKSSNTYGVNFGYIYALGNNSSFYRSNMMGVSFSIHFKYNYQLNNKINLFSKTSPLLIFFIDNNTSFALPVTFGIGIPI